jgi:hypothetical protein
MRENVKRAVGWIARWGLAVLVVSDAILGLWAGATVAVPADVPSFALQAAAVYKLEVGAAVFTGAYLVSLALVLAFRNRAFAEIGMSGIKVEEIRSATWEQGEGLGDLAEVVRRLREDLQRRDPERR